MGHPTDIGVLREMGRKRIKDESKHKRITVSVSPIVDERLKGERNKSRWVNQALEGVIKMEQLQKELNRIEHTYGMTLEEGAYQGTTDDRLGRWYWQDKHSTSVDRRGAGYANKEDAVEQWQVGERCGMTQAPYTIEHEEWGTSEAFGSLGAAQAAIDSLYADNDWGRAPELDDNGEEIYYYDSEAGERVYVGEIKREQ